MKQTVQLADTFASMLPLISDQLDGRLEEEDQTLTDLGDSLDQVREAIPAYSQTATRLLHTGRILAWLVAGIVGLHGCYLIVGARWEALLDLIANHSNGGLMKSTRHSGMAMCWAALRCRSTEQTHKDAAEDGWHRLPCRACTRSRCRSRRE